MVELLARIKVSLFWLAPSNTSSAIKIGLSLKKTSPSMIEKLLNIIPKNEDSADALAIAISAHHIGDDYSASNLQQANNSLDIAIAKALLKEKKKS